MGRGRPATVTDEFGFEERRQAPNVVRRASAGLAPIGRDEPAGAVRRPIKIYPFGVNRARLEAQIRSLAIPGTVVGNQREADVVLTVRNYYRRKPQALRDAEAEGVPVHVLRSNASGQIEEALFRVANLDQTPASSGDQTALRETEDAISEVLQTSRPVELSPQSAYVRKLQHQLAEQHSLASRSTGKEPYRRVRISKAD